MSGSTLPRILRSLGWILLPILTFFGILYCSAAPFAPQEVASMPDPPQVQGPAPSFDIAVALQHADGTPAPEGMILFFAPELATTRMDAEGVAHARLHRDGKLQFLAYAPGHALLEGERDSARGDLEPVRLLPLPDAVIPEGEKLNFLPRSVTLLDDQERPLVHALILARPAASRGAEPWVAFTDESGVAVFADTTDGALILEAYAPGLPPRKATRFERWELTADATEERRLLEIAHLEVTGLPPQGLLTWKRVDLNQLLSMIQVTDEGSLILGPVPPGVYRLQVGNRQLDATLKPGLQTMSFSATAAPQEPAQD
ncbi:MAG: hypothetical protein ACPG31_03420 [Planctomycetota bacterium]